jgi:hypothetical protein
MGHQRSEKNVGGINEDKIKSSLLGNQKEKLNKEGTRVPPG